MVVRKEKKYNVIIKNTEEYPDEGEIILFGKRLFSLINGEPYKSFAKKCNMSDKAIRDYVNGKTYPSLDRIAYIAEATGCSFTWLATGIDINFILQSEKNKMACNSPKIELDSSKLRELIGLLKRLTEEEQENLIQYIINYGIKSLIPYELSQQARAIVNILVSLPVEEQREILLLVETKKLRAAINQTSTIEYDE